jgi:hypothetical protein
MDLRSQVATLFEPSRGRHESDHASNSLPVAGTADATPRAGEDAGASGVPLGVELAVYLVCGLAGFVLGYRFGHQVTGGWGLGAVTGLLGVLFCTILASAVLAWIERQRGAGRRARSGRRG